MSLTESQIEFLEKEHSAAMITVGDDGVPKPVRVSIALIDGRIWSSGTEDRVRTKRLRRDPRCTLFVFDGAFKWLGLETTVTIIDGEEAAPANLRLFRLMQGRPTGPLTWFGGEYDEDGFLRVMTEEGRVVYDFEVQRSYGLF